MPMPAHLYVTGARQGKMEGSCEIQGREGSILVQEFKHEISIPRSPQTGQPTGKRVHNPLIITKFFDKSSPLLYQALTSGEKLTDVHIDWYRITEQGKEEHYFTIKLEDAIVVSMVPFMPNCLDLQYAQYQHMEEVAFTYRKITWTWEPDGIEGEDDWVTPK